MATPTIHGQDLGLVRVSDLLAAPFSIPKIDQETGIIAAQHKDGAIPMLKVTGTGTADDPMVWSDWRALQLFVLANGSFAGIGSSVAGFFS